MNAKKIGMVFGIVLVILGLIGFVGGFGIVGANGFFMTDMTHDIIHLVIGLVLLFGAMKSPSSMPMLLKVIGVVVVLVAILGLISSEDLILGFIVSNAAADWLHLVVGIVLLGAGFMGGKSNSGMVGGGMA